MAPFTKTIKSGTNLFRENDRSRELYIIQSGSVKVYRTAGGKEIPLATLEKGAVLGEMALIDGKPRSASVKALEDTSVIIIDADTFHNRIRGIPSWFISIVRSTSQKIRQANRRLQSITKDHQGARITITLNLYFKRFGKDTKALPVTIIQNHLIQLLGVTYRDLTNTLGFLCEHAFINLTKDSIEIPDPDRLDEYCEYLRFLLRNQMAQIATDDQKIGKLAEVLVSMFYDIIKKEGAFTIIDGDQFYHILESNNLAELHLDLIEKLQNEGYISCARKGKAASTRPLGDMTMRLTHISWKRAYLYEKYKGDCPK